MSENTKKPEYETNVVKPDVNFMIGDQSTRIISIEDELFLDGKLNELQVFTDNNHGLGKEEQEKDELYYTAQSSWKEMVERLKNMKYNFYLNRKQYNFLTNLLVSKLEYDVNTIFLAIELTNMLGNWELTKGKKDVKSDSEIKCYSSDATEITYMYHLIAKHTVKGLTHDTYTFAEILRIIGKISKIVSYYDSQAKTWNKDIQDWASTFDAGVYIEGKAWGRKESENLGVTAFGQIIPSETATGELKPKKTSKKKEEEKA
jgi:hypothetical protein